MNTICASFLYCSGYLSADFNLPLQGYSTEPALGQSHDFPSASEVTLKNTGQITELQLSCYLVLLSTDSKTR